MSPPLKCRRLTKIWKQRICCYLRGYAPGACAAMNWSQASTKQRLPSCCYSSCQILCPFALLCFSYSTQLFQCLLFLNDLHRFLSISMPRRDNPMPRWVLHSSLPSNAGVVQVWNQFPVVHLCLAAARKDYYEISELFSVPSTRHSANCTTWCPVSRHLLWH